MGTAMLFIRSFTGVCALWLSTTPALAGSGSIVPEPENMAMFAIGVIGLLIGRSASRKSHAKDADDT
jgi:hypothetical protein